MKHVVIDNKKSEKETSGLAHIAKVTCAYTFGFAVLSRFQIFQKNAELNYYGPKRILSSIHSLHMSAKAMYFFFNSFEKNEEKALQILQVEEISNENTIAIHELMKRKSKERINSFLYDQVGYYFFDCSWLFWSTFQLGRSLDISDFIHHFISLITPLIGIIIPSTPQRERAFPIVFFSASLMALPQTPLNIYWLLKKLNTNNKIKKTTMNRYFFMFYLFTWFVVRILMFPFIFYWYSKQEGIPFTKIPEKYDHFPPSKK